LTDALRPKAAVLIAAPQPSDSHVDVGVLRAFLKFLNFQQAFADQKVRVLQLAKKIKIVWSPTMGATRVFVPFFPGNQLICSAVQLQLNQ
jgi:hypothetical protein